MSWNPVPTDPAGRPTLRHSAYRDRTPRGPGMDPRQRLTTSMPGAAPWQQFTPDQSYFRRSVAQGRWTTDFNAGANAPANQLRQDPTTGCVDMIALEPWYNENGADQFVDLGGKGGVDFAAGRPS